MSYKLHVLKMGQFEVPGPEIYWMSHWNTWELMHFYIVVIQGEGLTAVINSGPPRDFSWMNEAWVSFLGERHRLVVDEETERPWNALKHIGVDPNEVKYVIVTPLQAYAIGNLNLFPSAQICVSRRGWIEDVVAPLRPPHLPRKMFIPDDVLHYLLFEAWDRVRLLGDEEQIAPGLRTFWAGVHHRASLAICIDTTEGTVIASDCFFKYPNVEQMHPLGIGESLEEAYATYERVRGEADLLLPLYDPEVLARHPGGIIG
jgi:hypothetical protein